MPYTLDGEALQPGQSFTIGEVQYPPNALELWSRADLEAIGLVWVEPLGPTLVALRAAANAAVNAKREAVFAGGYLVDGGPLDGLRLQLRNADDKANWLIVEKNALAAITGGAGDVPMVPIRTLENQTVTLTPNQAVAVMAGLEAWGRAVMARSWVLKDQNDQAMSAEALVAAEDVESGWP